ncbi:hypothetical protein HPB49_020325 [Dermacentor silvarum]|uniref:Uncharacterized protein n=1 Tax=Dermacentor silvarum TaxID=543639 RepID=A0ACB8D7Q8_DERSI|nr:hypothetical protein HPB49_020325 [Dermacentor silvarum]
MKTVDPKMQQYPDDTDARRKTAADTFQSARQIKTALNMQAREETIRRRMREAGLRGFVAAQKPYLTKHQRRRRHNADELWFPITREWKCLGEERDFGDALYESIPRRLEAALHVDGAFARY